MSGCRGWKYDLGEMKCWVCYSLVESKHFRARAEKLSNLYLHFDESFWWSYGWRVHGGKSIECNPETSYRE